MADENFGYGDVEEVVKAQGGGNKYLNFKKGDKGRVIQIRLVSEPRYINQHWVFNTSGVKSPVNCTGEKCEYCNDSNLPNTEDPKRKVAKWGWIVIDRQDEGVKIFTGPTQIARSIRDMSGLINMKTKNLVWGNPQTYDIQIERTEEPGANYYKVTGMTDGREPLTEDEKAKIAKNPYDLSIELQGSKKSEHLGSYNNGGAKELETAPEDAVNPDDIPADLGEESSDIPF